MATALGSEEKILLDSSKAGVKREKKEAASITPAEKLKQIHSLFLLSFFTKSRGKNPKQWLIRQPKPQELQDIYESF